MSDFKMVEGSFPWTDRDNWLLPAADQNTIGWPFEHGSIDVDAALEVIGPVIKDWRTCVQAGGCIGIWPMRLAQYFKRVITFEPENTNYLCLLNNAMGVENIEFYRAALGQDNTQKIQMGLEERYIGHCGAFQVMPDGDIPVIRIDDLELDDVDLIYLDVEGSEYDVLAGAAETINRCRPVIGMEQKGFNNRYNNGASPVDLLRKNHKYKILCKPFKTDVILVPC